MDFIHQPYVPGETIAAIATPPGEGGVAIVRISGNQAFDVAKKVFSGPVHSYKSHTAHYGQIRDLNNQPIDDVLLLVMRGRRSYTGEDTVEVQCHGGSLITRHVLEVILKAGARAARPGEFTFKAFMNGKLDLAQAEAVQSLIGARNEYALQAAESQLKGSLSAKVLGFQERLTLIAAILEAWVDFPDEGLEFTTLEEICQDLEAILIDMQSLFNTFRDGKILQEGISLCLVGCPNVGKSSLMNALLDKERAIVSHFPGTTRDIVEDEIRLNGLNLRLLDTAGIRVTDELVEQEGIRRSKEAMGQADLILLVLDATKGIEEQDHFLLKEVPAAKTIVIWNKIDLPHVSLPAIAHLPYVVPLSAKQKIGLDRLRQVIDSVIWKEGPPSKEEVLITNVRHREALQLSIQAGQNVLSGLKGNISPEFLSMDMRQCLAELGKIIGTNISEDILSAIFSTFCIGK
ncbi:tRNA modification GTPase MnmE [Neochlamydia sp. TUME1]|uniref:tRNA uridine-5-carboxymethylaminomethyl(34) synthesis GTPase MnmE n=1 Tax=Neochlamydia sp. TUME1 TaxID=1478174 RepID=UPI00057D5FDB|nr:tRNA uridine-5-carboxymethylaminomethyl(34) synthesis GTPase MnmE [Neochlamydia sp. TUME1]KIC71584.1 tRNA modification GTPase MnmE [Neochlamydia sp. TUME1]